VFLSPNRRSQDEYEPQSKLRGVMSIAEYEPIPDSWKEKSGHEARFFTF
jgi:hypothetical protein